MTSQRSAAVLGCIDVFGGGERLGCKVRILYRVRHHKINIASGYSRESFLEPKVVSQKIMDVGKEFNEEVDVAVVGIEVFGDS